MSADIKIGELFDSRYNMRKLLGGGRVGKVYLARDIKNNCDVAVKILTHHLDSERDKVWFDSEFAAIKNLNHPGVVRVYEQGDGYFTMEYVDGTPLRKARNIDVVRIFEIGVDIVRVLEYIHRQGVIHRDLKPENIKITPDKEVKLLDFGFAIGSQVSKLISSDKLNIAGTLNYMAPEVIKGFEVDPRADLYSLGIIFYELTTGRLPFKSSDILTTVVKQMEMTPPLPKEINPAITPGFEAIIMKLISKSPAKRYQTADELLSAMMKLAGRSEIIKIKVERGRKFLHPPKFTGREKELSRILSLFKKAMKGRGSFVLVYGEAGLGKTRLIREFQKRHQNQEVIFSQVICDSTFTAPLAAFGQIIYRLFRSLEKMQDALVSELATRWGPMLLPVVPALTHKSYMFGVAPSEDLLPEALRQQLCQFFVEISKKYSIGLFIDDLQWLDQESCYLLLDLVQETQEHAVFMCGTYCATSSSGEETFRHVLPRLKVKKICEKIELQPLDQQQLTPMLKSMIGKPDLDNALQNRLYEVSRGIPLLAEEAIYNMADDGLIYRKGGVLYLEIDDLRKIRRPSLLEDSLLEKYEKLDKKSMRILQVAAVIGHRFPQFLLEKLCKINSNELLQYLPTLVREGFLSEVNETGEPFLAIGSLRLAELLSEKIPLKLRQKIHEEVAKFLESTNAEKNVEKLAHHYFHARQRRKALHYLIRAGELNERRYAYSTAIEYHSNALEIASQKKSAHHYMPGLLQKLGDIHSQAGQHDVALQYYHRGLHLAQERDEDDDNFHKGIGKVYFQKSQFNESLQHLTILLDALRLKKKNMTEELTLVASIYIEMGSYEQAEPLLKEALGYAKHSKRQDLQASIYNLYAQIHFNHGYFSHAMNYYFRALDILQSCGSQHLKARVSRGVARVYIQQGQTKEAYKYLENALYFCHLIGDRELRVLVEIDLGLLFEQEGKMTRAMEIYHESLELAQDLEMQLGRGLALMHLGRVFNLCEKNTEAFEYLENSLNIFKELQITWAIGECYTLLGEMYTDQAEYQQAIDAFNAAEKAFLKIQSKWKTTDIHAGLARIYQKCNQIESANKSINKALKLAKKYNDAITSGKIHTRYAIFCADNNLHREALEHFVSAIVFLDRGTSKIELARTYYEYGRALLEFERGGDYGFLKVAVHQLEKARDLYSEDNVQPWLSKTLRLIKECEREKTDALYKRDLVVKLREFGREISEFELEGLKELQLLKDQFCQEIEDEMEREEVLVEIEKRINEAKAGLNNRLTELQQQNSKLLSRVEELKAERDSLLTLQKISTAINSVLDSQKLLNMIMDMVIRELRSERGFIVLKDDEDDGFTFKAARNIDKEALSQTDFNLSRSIVKKVIKTGEPVLTSDAQADGRFQSESITDLKLRSILCVPFKLKDRVIGAVYVDNRFVSGLFTERNLDFLVAFSNQAAIAIENAFLYEEITEKQRMEQELSIAAHIQSRLLPTSLPEIEGLEIYGHMMPAREVGGDYYDFIVAPDDRSLAIVIGDVTGKGIPAGLVMVMARIILHYFLADNNTSTKSTLITANRLLKDNTEAFIFMSMLLARWDIDKQKLIYTGAGHENLIVCRAQNSELEVILAGGVVLGIKDDIENLLEENELELESGDSVIFYTDGVTECVSSTGEMLELEGFLEMVRKYPGQSCKETVNNLLEELKNYMGGAEQHDDITLTMIRKI